VNWTYIEDIHRHEGEEVTLKGWLYNKRSSGKLHFLQVRDGTGTLQCVVFKGDVTPEEFALAEHLSQESSLTVTGLVRADARAPLGFELAVKHIELVSISERPSGPSPGRRRPSSSAVTSPSPERAGSRSRSFVGARRPCGPR
jgi:aspartyl/asparaginyl-tRNA synthetase